jgi:hypothetical protein
LLKSRYFVSFLKRQLKHEDLDRDRDGIRTGHGQGQGRGKDRDMERDRTWTRTWTWTWTSTGTLTPNIEMDTGPTIVPSIIKFNGVTLPLRN